MKKVILLMILIFSISNSYSQDPDDFIMLQIAGNASKLNGDIKEAIDYYSQAIKLKPNQGGPYGLRAEAKNLLEDFSGAIKDSNKAIKLNPKTASFYYNRAYAKSQLDDFHGAVIDYTKSIQLETDNDAKAKSYFQRGLCRLNIFMGKEACIDFSKASKLGNNKAYEAIQQYCN